jgi:hypothetical protein
MSNINWLDEVKADAKYNYLKRLREQEEDRRFEEAKQKGTVKEVLSEVLEPTKKGK